MSQTLFFTDKTKPPLVISDNSSDGTSTSIPLRGIGSSPYGTEINQALLWLLENFANDVPPLNPIEGQVWFDNFFEVVKVYNGISWELVTKIVRSDTPPDQTGELWFDTSVNQLKVYNGASYVSVAENYLPLMGGTLTGNVTFESLSCNGTHQINDQIDIVRMVNYHTINFQESATLFKGSNSLTVQDINGNMKMAVDGSVLNLSSSSAISFANSISINDPTSSRVFVTPASIDFFVDIDASSNVITEVKEYSSGTRPTVRNQLDVLESNKPLFVLESNGDMTGGFVSKTPTSQVNLDYSSIVFATPDREISIGGTGGILTVRNVQTLSDLVSFDSSSAVLNLHNKFLSNLEPPRQESDAANKVYADDQLGDQFQEVIDQFSMGQSKAWVKYNINTESIVSSFNILNVTKDAIGTWTVNLSNGASSGRTLIPFVSYAAGTPTASRYLKYNTFYRNLTPNSCQVLRTVDRLQARYRHDGGDDGSVDAYQMDYADRINSDIGHPYIEVVFYEF